MRERYAGFNNSSNNNGNRIALVQHCSVLANQIEIEYISQSKFVQKPAWCRDF